MTPRRLFVLATLLGCATALNTLAGDDAYLFATFRGNGQDGLHLATSKDGLDWTALKNDESFLKPEVGGKLMRDPCIIQGPDGYFHMVWTSSWRERGIGISHSKDLIEWSDQKFIPVMEHEETAHNCWAPEITWDPDGEQYVIYWATTIPGRYPETEDPSGDVDKGVALNHRIYCTTTKDFKDYTEAEVFYDPGFNVIDSTITKFGDKYVMITKEETRNPPAKNLHVAFSDKVTGPWKNLTEPFSPAWVEGPTTLIIGDYLYVYYDMYRQHQYGVMRTKDCTEWEDVSDQLSVPNGTRHGTILTVSQKILRKLKKED